MTGVDRQIVEPLTNYGVVRVQQDFKGGDADIGLIGTAVNRSDDQWTRPYLHQSAYSAGATFRNRLSGRRYEVAGSSPSRMSPGRPTRSCERSCARCTTTSSRAMISTSIRRETSLSGYSAQLKLGKYSGGITRFETSIVPQSRDSRRTTSASSAART